MVQAKNEEGICSYRTNTGCKCAFGCLIPDSMYEHKMERKNAIYVLDVYKNLRKHLEIETSSDTYFIQGLQNIHDENPPEQWENKLIGYAMQHGLQP
jgi:hypothetical protein